MATTTLLEKKKRPPMELENLVPLFHIFLHSPTPEGEASAWLDQHNQQSKPSHHLTSTFLSQLLSPVDVVSPNPIGPPAIERCLWIQTLPFVVQTRILSFLAIENHRFCHRSLHSLATQILDGVDEQFWVERAARHLLDEMSVHSFGSKGKKIELDEDFYSMPQWLKDAASMSCVAFPWQPLSPQQLCRWVPTSTIADDGADLEESSLMDDMQGEKVLDELGNFHVERRASELSLDTQILEKATSLKGEILSMSLPSDVIRVSCDIGHLLLEANGQEEYHLRILERIQPWEAEDDKAPLLLSHLTRECGFDHPDWPSHVFAAILLPKLLKLKQPASRAIQASCIDFCKSHPKLVGRSVLFPLMYRVEGINVAVRDILSRVLKEMHPSYVSAFCHRLLCMRRTQGDFICLPCHSNMILDKMLWTESMFSLFQQILSLNLSFTPETVDELISVAETMHRALGKSVKFGSFLLCLVTKSSHAVKFHKITLMGIAKKTDTFVTKSIISKLENQ